MTFRNVAAIFICSLSLAACADTTGLGFRGEGPIDSEPGVSDPTSPIYFQQTVGDRVLFDIDQSSLSTAAREILTAQAIWLAANPEFTAIIEGHADEQGTREYNLALGERRAVSVRDFLIAQGVDAGRLRTVTYGKERPIEICSTETCYSQNRRAVTVVAGGIVG